MLRPTKHSHPDKTVISVALVLLRHLRKQRVAEYDALRAAARKAAGSAGEVFFLPAINFLYLLGLVNYHSKTDAFEYTNSK